MMKRTLAVQVMDAIRAAEAHVNTLEAPSEEITDDQERRAFRRHLAEVMIGYIDIQTSIVRQYPDLDPDQKPAGETVEHREAVEIPMEKAVAARIMDAALSLGKEINNLDSLIGQLDNEGEKEGLVRALGAIMGILTRDVILRLARDHPELDPER